MLKKMCLILYHWLNRFAFIFLVNTKYHIKEVFFCFSIFSFKSCFVIIIGHWVYQMLFLYLSSTYWSCAFLLIIWPLCVIVWGIIRTNTIYLYFSSCFLISFSIQSSTTRPPFCSTHKVTKLKWTSWQQLEWMLLAVSERRLVKWCQFTFHHRKFCKWFPRTRYEGGGRGSERTARCLSSVPSSPHAYAVAVNCLERGMVSAFWHGKERAVGTVWPQEEAWHLPHWRFVGTEWKLGQDIFSLSFSRVLAKP